MGPDAIAEAHDLIIGVLRGGSQAATSCRRRSRPSTPRPLVRQTDWPQVVTLYDRLLEVWPSPVVALNRAVPLAEVAGPAAALAEVEALAG